MKLVGTRKHLSIQPFEEIEVPKLTILIGPNGSGKSHFLQALENGSIVTDIIGPIEMPRTAKKKNHILILDGANAPTNLEKSVQSNLTPSAEHPAASYAGLASQFERGRSKLLAPSIAALQNVVGDTWDSEADENEIWLSGPEAFAERVGAEDRLPSIRKIFIEAAEALVERLTQPLPKANSGTMPSPTSLKSAIYEVSTRLDISPLAVNSAQIRDLNFWGGFEAFDPNVANIFGKYRDAHVRNDLQRIRDNRKGTSKALTDDEFLARYGTPPWEIVSDTLRSFGLNYQVAEPSDEPTAPVTFSLKRLDTGVRVSFNALSSGERVLLRFALSLLNYDPLRVGVTLPRLLLLDEMDASLHPEMAHRWLTSIIDGLVKEKSIHCVLTTHSPTTVALAPEESLFELSAGDSRPRKVSKQQALNRLTFGLPTLSIDYSGRRQVFVESDTDAASYETIASVMKGTLQLPRTLTFISTGVRKENVEANTGCAVVKKLVSELAKKGNVSVFGLIDWDGKNESQGRVRVLAEGTHYALENLLLDPLLIGALLLRDRKLKSVDFTFASLSSLTIDELQLLADAVQSRLEIAEVVESLPSAYQAGFSLHVHSVWRKMRGHDLEQLIMKAHPSLNRYGSGRGKLTYQVADAVLRDYPQFCPMPIADVLRTIAMETV